ncbi:hypothetical protein Prudu_016189 [Prunus dulcis]|uniref:Uncharacterized protein n=1 Tax=Prunus dulcis TaxID=3755 RepID=A0A4Y1RKQ5_PRUDU|nr:hypothetical protein Prudu_016189 [Prunus dulcis]
MIREFIVDALTRLQTKLARSKVLSLKLPLETNKSCPFPTSRSRICCSKKKKRRHSAVEDVAEEEGTRVETHNSILSLIFIVERKEEKEKHDMLKEPPVVSPRLTLHSVSEQVDTSLHLNFPYMLLWKSLIESTWRRH